MDFLASCGSDSDSELVETEEEEEQYAQGRVPAAQPPGEDADDGTRLCDAVSALDEDDEDDGEGGDLEDGGIRLNSHQLALIKDASIKQISHVSLYSANNQVRPSEEYPTTWSLPCACCLKRFSTVPVFLVHSFDPARQQWRLYSWGHCSLVCAKSTQVSEGGVTASNRM